MTPGRRREVVEELRGTWKVSIRRACSAVQAQRSSFFYKSRRPDRAPLTTRIKEIAETRVRYGYRRIHVLLRREGWLVNVKLVNRLYREMSLQLRNKSPKRKVKAKLREGREAPAGRNDVWAMDFVHDQLFDATKVRVLTILDAFTRFSPVIEPRFTWRGSCVVEALERACRQHGFPRTIRVDQGPEFISKDLDLWAYRRGVILDFSRPGKPTDNAYIESLNGKFRAECLNVHWFTSLDEMHRICEDWRRDYNEVRPHSAIGNKPPMSLMNCSGPHGPA
jgi:putative transposase